jgi:hypothetical protein
MAAQFVDVAVNEHLIDRLRERWPDCLHEEENVLRHYIKQQVGEALRTQDFVRTPGGTYMPFSYLGKDGYVVVEGGEAKTVMPEEWCPEVAAVRRRKKNG